jgi:hypothetical protein
MVSLKINNLLFVVVAALMAVIGIVVGIVTKTGHNIFLGAMFGCMAWVLAKAD